MLDVKQINKNESFKNTALKALKQTMRMNVYNNDARSSSDQEESEVMEVKSVQEEMPIVPQESQKNPMGKK